MQQQQRVIGILEVESNEDITLLDTRAKNDPPLTLQGPITRARARRLNHEVNSLLTVHTINSKDEMLIF